MPLSLIYFLAIPKSPETKVASSMQSGSINGIYSFKNTVNPGQIQTLKTHANKGHQSIPHFPDSLIYFLSFPVSVNVHWFSTSKLDVHGAVKIQFLKFIFTSVL